MRPFRLLFLSVSLLALAGFTACDGDDHDHGDDYANNWNEATEEANSGKADSTECSGVRVPDQGGFGKQVALTFDDGPNPATTPKVLDILARYEIKATFFINGSRVKGDTEREILARIMREGHILANHSHDHKNLKKQTLNELERQITATHDIIVAAGEEQRYFRFPYGSAGCTAAARVRDFNYIVSGWHVDSGDWCFANGTGGVGHCAERTFAHVPDAYRSDMGGFVMSQVNRHEGGIVLFHDIHANTADSLESIIQSMIAGGYTFTNMDDAQVFPLLNGSTPVPTPFVGDVCAVEADCNFSADGAAGSCFEFSIAGGAESYGFCSLACDGYCPDKAGSASTFCTSVDGGGSGICVSKASPLNNDCEAIPGTSAAFADRFVGNSSAAPSEALVCYPGDVLCEDDLGCAAGYTCNTQLGVCVQGAQLDALCEDTGGVWESNSCECAQDGASVDYEFIVAEGGCVHPDFAIGGIKKLYADDLGAGWDEFVDPSVGLWVIHRPGVADVPAKFNDLAEVSDALAYVVSGADGFSCEVVEESAPTYDCETEFSKDGCFATPVDSYDGISSLMALLNSYQFADFSDDEIATATRFELNVDTQVVSTANGMTLYFGVVDGAWRLLVIDVASFDCSA